MTMPPTYRYTVHLLDAELPGTRTRTVDAAYHVVEPPLVQFKNGKHQAVRAFHMDHVVEIERGARVHDD